MACAREAGEIDYRLILGLRLKHSVMGAFHVADLTAQGELQLQAEYRYEELEQIPGAGEMIGHFSGLCWQSPGGFATDLDNGLSVRLTAPAPTTAIASLGENPDKHLSLSLLLTGLDAEADRLTLAALQTHILRELHGTPFEPAFALLQITARPLVASIHLALPTLRQADRTFALADRCLAAAFFRYHHLV